MGDLVYWGLLVIAFIAMFQTGNPIPFLVLLAFGAAILILDKLIL